MIENIVVLIASFYIYAFSGWVWESVILPVFRKQIPYNRGFLNGPWIPIYGFGAILVIILFNHKYQFYVLFLSSGVVACLLEYITSYIMERLFSRRWWDYSNKLFNLNGRICLEGFVCFGLFSVLVIKYIQPFFEQKLININKTALVIISVLLTIFFIVDVIFSILTALEVKKKLDLLRVFIDEKEEKIINDLKNRSTNAFDELEKYYNSLRKQQLFLKSKLEKEGLFKYRHRRLIKAFPHIIKKRRKEK